MNGISAQTFSGHYDAGEDSDRANRLNNNEIDACARRDNGFRWAGQRTTDTEEPQRPTLEVFTLAYRAQSGGPRYRAGGAMRRLC